MGILILLGHENDGDGHLSATAIARCDRAIEILTLAPELKVLPTGAYGRIFNQTSRAHSKYLTDYLVQHGIARGRILPSTMSSNTIEDALCARKIVVECGASKIIVVTSVFHLRRTQLIFERVFPDKELQFEGATDMLSTAELLDIKKDEVDKYDHTRREWVDTPLYGSESAGPILGEIYQIACAEHKHYDNVSLAIVTGMVLIFIYPYTRWTLEIQAVVFLLFSSVIMCCLTLMYELNAQTARTARRVMRSIELSQGAFGFSVNYPKQEYRLKERVRKVVNLLRSRSRIFGTLNREPGIRGIVILLSFLMIATQVCVAIVTMIMVFGGS